MQHLLGFKCKGYVEYEEYCQKVIKQRQVDGVLDTTPIFGDIKKFISEGYAEAYKGMVDLITGGFPCQPFSVAGKGLAENDPRNMWPQTKNCISIIRPKYCFLENVPGLLSHKYIRRIFGDLAEMGYNCKWGIIGADDLGAPHRRKRLWIYASNSDSERRGKKQEFKSRLKNKTIVGDDGEQKYVADPNQNGLHDCGTLQNRITRAKQPPDDSEPTRERGLIESEGLGENKRRITWWEQDPADVRNPESNTECEKQCFSQRAHSEHGGDCTKGRRPIKSFVGRVAAGCPNRVDRLKALGNMQVPAVAATAWEILNGHT